MDTFKINAVRRKLGAKSILNELRRNGKVPAILHNPGKDSVPVTFDSADIKKALATSSGQNVLLSLTVDDDEAIMAMFENISRDPLRTGVYQHIDVRHVALNQKLEVEVPILITGQQQRQNDGGMLYQHVFSVALRATPQNIPQNIEVDVQNLTIGDSVYLRQIGMPDNCDAVTSLDELLVSIVMPRAQEVETPDTDEVQPSEGMPDTADTQE